MSEPQNVPSSEPPKVKDLLGELKNNPELQHQSVEENGLDPKLALLRAWQSQRLARTYADLLANPQYAAACQFFLSDIYAPKDFSQRNYDAARIHSYLSRILPPRSIQLLTNSIGMNRLADELDHALLDVLVNQLGVKDAITEEQYAEAYRLCDNYAERLRQIETTSSILKEVADGARQRVVGLAIQVGRGPATRAGWGELVDFLVRGREAFKAMKDSDTFVDTIEAREKLILDQIYSNNPHPFQLAEEPGK